jgi:DNA-binding response OmpR family regulator
LSKTREPHFVYSVFEGITMSSILPTILIIENDLPSLELYRRELGRDFRVLACFSKGETLDAIDSQNPTAIILEPAALNEDGWDLLTAIVSLPDRSLPVILCTILDERKRGLKEGAVAYLIKPVLPAALLETLHNVIRKMESSR